MHVFITFYGGGHVTMGLPVIRELERRGHRITILALTTAAAVLRREGIAYRHVIDYVDPEDPAIRRWGEHLATRHHTDGKGITREESIAYLGTLLNELVQDVGEPEALARYAAQGLNAFLPVRFASRILREHAPDAVIATPSPRMESAMLRAAHRLGVPSLCMVDLFALLELPWLRDPEHGHVLTVYSERIALRLAEAGRDPRQIFVTGNPAFDPLASPHHIAAGPHLRAEKGIAAGEKLILWAEQPEPDNPDLPRAIRRQLAKLCAARPGWRLIVRLHPSSTDPRGETIPAGALCSPATESLPALLYAVDAVVTLTSTVAMEGLLADKPVLVARISQYSHLVDYSPADGAAVVDCAADIPAALEQILGDTPEAAQMAQNRRSLPRAGSAASRVCDVVENHLRAAVQT